MSTGAFAIKKASGCKSETLFKKRLMLGFLSAKCLSFFRTALSQYTRESLPLI